MKCILFTSASCKACPAMKRNLAEAGIEFEEKNVDSVDGCAKAGSCRVKSLPTLVIMSNDVPVESFVGVRSVRELVQIMGRYGR